MIITRSRDIEDELRDFLALHGFTAYCRPLPAEYPLPNIVVTQAGGNTTLNWAGRKKLDQFMVVLDVRAETDAEAYEVLNNAVGALQGSDFCVIQNTTGTWGNDPVRPDLAMRTATLVVTARPETISI